MSQLVECVPNFSEGNNQEVPPGVWPPHYSLGGRCCHHPLPGRDSAERSSSHPAQEPSSTQKVIDAISQAISQTPGCVLLDVDAGPSTNRTVYTFVGRPDRVVEGALSAARVASRLIDMSRHRGEHPRMGALDVCPFIPVRGVGMDECVLCAEAFGQRLAEELHVPVFLYGEAARTASRRSLPAIRAGEYEALPEKLKQAEWAPDFGPSSFVPSWGATATGARKFLIAFNINLLSTKEQAHRIALNLREQGRGQDQPGRLKKLQAIGWYLDEKNLAQVSTNLLDFEVTALHTVYEETCREAQELSLPVVGSQLVGLVPLKALLDAAAFYCDRENLFVLEEEHRLRLVVNRLGLDSLSPFHPEERVIEYLVPDRRPERSLVDKSLCAFVRGVGARSAVPGGGSVAAAAAAMGAALASMVGLMTYGRRQFEHLDAAMRRLIPPFHAAAAELTALVDADAQAFASYLEAMKLPKSTPEERDRRAAALQEGLRQAVSVPLALAETVASLWPALRELALCGNLACRSDLQVAAKALETGVFGAYFNVLVNLKDITDDAFKDQTRQRISSLLQEAKTQAALVLDCLEARRE
ncbi:PREDICTED: formimidoyltransferase-cyclodeaminase isoform X1 [Propithecus coquereli]|uniref:formimidoyltransferase-cyclodeaminase isoform X1 n=1 Tax=Propithecus coquereli TaxID=379532 RepID=UPI00063EEB2D|nr:PREDICTED: formimidoyltransferase-cyclodeaminase isoform X1 [Propithecus coquereli]